jgi:hypothetical protein
MATNDPFAKYLTSQPDQSKDPFAAYVGPKEQDPKDPIRKDKVASEASDPFEQYVGPADAVDKEIKERSFFDRPALGAEDTSKEEIAAIAAKHKVDPEELLNLAPYFGARIKGADFAGPEELKRAAGTVGSILLNIPQKAYKKSVGGNLEAALDDIQNLASGRQSYVQLVGEAAVPGVGIGTKAVSTAGKVAGGAATGAVAGYSGASSEQELPGALFGAAVGGTATALVSRLARRAPAKIEQEAVAKTIGPELDAGTETILKRKANSEALLGQALDNKLDLNTDNARKIVKEQVDPATFAKMLDAGSEEGRLIREAVSRELPDLISKEGFQAAIERKLAKDLIDSRTKDFAQSLSGTAPKNLEDAREVIADYASRQGAEATSTKYKLMVEEQAALDYIKENAIRLGRGDNFQDKALNLLSDAQFVLRDIDQRAGTSLESVHRKLNSSLNRMSFARDAARKDINAIFNANKAVDKSITDTDKVYRALDTGDMSGLSLPEQAAAADFKDYFNKQLNFVNGLVKSKDPNINPLNIPKRENYVPHMLLDTEDLIGKVDKKVNQIKEIVSTAFGRSITDLAQLTPQEFRQLITTKPMQELLGGLKVFDAKAINSGAELSARLKDTFNSRSGRLKLESSARAALERQGSIPEWMRETNLYKLADRWSTNTLKHLYLRRELDALRSIAVRLDKAGAELEATYINNLLGDLNGIRKGSMAEKTRQYGIAYQQMVDRFADQAKSPAAKGVVAVAKAIPTILEDINKQVYPNLLGLSPRALLMNATQTIAKTAPELGTKYGYTTLMRGAVKAVLDHKNMAKRLEQQGFIPAEFTAKYRQAVSDGIRRSSLYAIPNQTLNAMGNAAMLFYTKMDGINRSIALGTADMMAADLAKGNKLALESLRKMPSTVQREVAKATSQEQIANIIGSHLNASTQYNYNRASMSEYGRTMGPLFSTFSKWPTATLGEMVQEYRQRGVIKGTLRNAEKYAAPLLLFQAADYLINQGQPEEDASDIQKKLLGVSGLSQSSPIGSIKGIIEGDFFTPPAIDAVMQGLVVPALNGDPDKLQKGLASSIQNFTPGSVYVRVLTDDLPTLITGERPEGSDFLERSAEGVRKALK